MLKRRLIPVLFLKDGWMVRSEEFRTHQIIGEPVSHVERMVQWDVDELIVIDISKGAETAFEHHRSDYRHKTVSTLLDFIQMISVDCRIPLTIGGRVNSVDAVAQRIRHGADKVTINSAALKEPVLISDCAKVFGSQAIVASVDYKTQDDDQFVWTDFGKTRTQHRLLDWVRVVEDQGAGEILLTDIDRDGSAQGYDLETIDRVANAVSIPVIACSGAGHQRHFLSCFENTGASAVAAGNIFHFTENAYPRAKTFLRSKLADIR
ncbi:MAG: imidazole glycerol phosphate synthase cyclase subunit [Rhodospirillaceae bacterium]|jgi:cyclase|uniref:imidazole glycerol phosphate synthase subunit HisF n=1 Tax=Hwanghaeella sp. 1Z406 TaxID=3402811 RepID=UPI000C40A959|nr:imidazole glycerol phosphate synthase cyclase subunit [Rhodospirillales bacterium]MAX47890.1 imidazole glycerol phosphate synthase cyclase subunit [Rhodospirillaceae bacterium]|tara:strand:- start:3208 stop:3999 length:792 start_codon:yes stop_codon:yes gene_type:complete